MKPIFYTETLFSDFNEWLHSKAYSMLIFLVDENTHEHCLPLVLGEIETETPIEIIEIESGETHKTIETCTQIWSILTEFGADRNALILNLGGGVICDMGGFIASTYLRGVDFVNFPTSLLAMVDASVGGKTGVDLEHLKNRIGLFADAQKVLIIPEFLETLPTPELMSGFAEMLKHGLIADATHFKNLNSLAEITPETVAPLIEPSVMIKYEVVEKDPTEKGLRKILNFGHTIGHAIETFHLNQGNPILHGFAVAIGMFYESKLAFQKGILNSADFEESQKAIDKRYLIPTYNEGEVNEFVKLMYADKKNTGKEIQFALIDKIGDCKFNISAQEEEIKRVFFD